MNSKPTKLLVKGETYYFDPKRTPELSLKEPLENRISFLITKYSESVVELAEFEFNHHIKNSNFYKNTDGDYKKYKRHEVNGKIFEFTFNDDEDLKKGKAIGFNDVLALKDRIRLELEHHLLIEQKEYYSILISKTLKEADLKFEFKESISLPDKIPAKFYALYHWHLVKRGKVVNDFQDQNNRFIKHKIIELAKSRYPGISPDSFYKHFIKIDITKPNIIQQQYGTEQTFKHLRSIAVFSDDIAFLSYIDSLFSIKYI